MRNGDGLVIAALAAIATGVGCASVWVLTAHGRLEAFFAGSLVLLGLAQMLAILRQRGQAYDVAARLDDLADNCRQHSQRLAGLADQLNGTRAAAGSEPQTPVDELANEVKSLHSTLRGLRERRPESRSSRPDPGLRAQPGHRSRSKKHPRR